MQNNNETQNQTQNQLIVKQNYYSRLGISDNEDLFDILGIKPEFFENNPEAAITEEFERLKRNLLLKLHPDLLENPTDQDQEAFHKVNRAYKILSNPKKREIYF